MSLSEPLPVSMQALPHGVARAISEQANPSRTNTDILSLRNAAPSSSVQQQNFAASSLLSQPPSDDPPLLRRDGPEAGLANAAAVDELQERFRGQQRSQNSQLSDDSTSSSRNISDSYDSSVEPQGAGVQVSPSQQTRSDIMSGSKSNLPLSPSSERSVANAPRSVTDAVRVSDRLISENSENEELKKRLRNLEEQLLHRTLEDMKKNKDISLEEYKQFDKEVSKAGLKLSALGPDTRKGLTGGLLGMVSATLQERLKDVKIEDGGVAFQADLQKAVDHNTSIGEMVKLRDYVISRTGRENGPDIALKVILSIKDQMFNDVKHIIHENSSITEVMNLLAFLLNNNEQRKKSIVEEFSIKSGTHDENGNYTTLPHDEDTSDSLETVFDSLTGGTSPFDISELKVYKIERSQVGKTLPADEIIIPAGILKRDPYTYSSTPITIKRDQIPLLFKACVLQMVNILENTRQVFGGWTKLFKGMQGGKSNSKSKKTRRRYNRRH